MSGARIEATGAVGAAERAPGEPRPAHGAEEVGREFEAIFVRTLLRSSPLGARGDVYADMGVDALAKGITAGGGLGLAELIRRAIDGEGLKNGR